MEIGKAYAQKCLPSEVFKSILHSLAFFLNTISYYLGGKDSSACKMDKQMYCLVLVSLVTYVIITELQLQSFFFLVGGGEGGRVNKQSQ